MSKDEMTLSYATRAANTALRQLANSKCFGGFVRKFQHPSFCTNSEMKFQVFLPPQAVAGARVPVLYWLSGLTCNEDNFMHKAGAFNAAAKSGVMIVCPDTSPRGCNIEGDKASWDFGEGAGFYVNATEPKWERNYRMYDYVVHELPALVDHHLPSNGRQSVFGHSMGGHGALVCFLRNPNRYASVSAFSPICHPSVVPWGVKAFTGYLGSNKEAWKQYDATELVKVYNGPKVPILIDQGTDDQFLPQKQLLPEDFEAAAKTVNYPVTIRMQEGYDHSYYFISTFVEDHISHHARMLATTSTSTAAIVSKSAN